MIDLSTDYVGLKLKNPLVPSASPLSKNLDMALRLEDAGAGALVMYSLFEEELRAEEAMADRFLLHADLGHGEADGFLPDHGHFTSCLDQYLDHLRQLKQRLEIPVIASLNGFRCRVGSNSARKCSRPAPMRWNSMSITSPPSDRSIPAMRWKRAISTC
jgi:dihydroorotate dehydrogenase (fumarate)